MGWKEPEELKLRDPLHPCPLPICDVDGETCQNGECKSPDFCACEVGWEGALCDICIPMPGCQHGNCTGALECNCADGWSGGYCEIRKLQIALSVCFYSLKKMIINIV